MDVVGNIVVVVVDMADVVSGDTKHILPKLPVPAGSVSGKAVQSA